MPPLRTLLLTATALSLSLTAAAAQPINTYTGAWKTYDEETKALNSIVTITKKHNAYVGTVSKIYEQHGHKASDLCVKCKGKLHNKPIQGMNVLHFTLGSNGKPENCKILDPNNGSLYHCKLDLLEKGAKLNVRGYIGLPLIGRDEVWDRDTSEDLKHEQNHPAVAPPKQGKKPRPAS